MGGTPAQNKVLESCLGFACKPACMCRKALLLLLLHTCRPARQRFQHKLRQLLCWQVLQPRSQAGRPPDRAPRHVQLHVPQPLQAGQPAEAVGSHVRGAKQQLLQLSTVC